MTPATELLERHVEALFTRNAEGRLVTVNDTKRARAPRFFLGCTAEGNGWWFRYDVDASLMTSINTLCAAIPKRLYRESVASFAEPIIAV